MVVPGEALVERQGEDEVVAGMEPEQQVVERLVAEATVEGGQAAEGMAEEVKEEGGKAAVVAGMGVLVEASPGKGVDEGRNRAKKVAS